MPREPGGAAAALVELRGVTTSFPGVVANNNVDLELRRGEVLGLLGENGAGKTTLVRVLAGLQSRDSGDILMRGEPVRIQRRADARRLGIEMVHQHFSLSPKLSVLENVLIGARDTGARLQLQTAEREIRSLSDRLGLPIDPNASIADLSVGERQRVEIVKCLRNDPSVLILDEPTAVLNVAEVAALYEVVRERAAQGAGVVFITHKLEELLSATDRIVVMRAGRVVATFVSAQADHRTLARAMVGGAGGDELTELGVGVAHGRKNGHRSERSGDPVLELCGVTVRDRFGQDRLNAVDLDVGRGEIVGVAGIEGNGQSSIVDVVSGIEPAAAGVVKLDGRDVTADDPSSRLRAGLAVIHEDRHAEGAIPAMTVAENLAFSAVDERRFRRFGMVRWAVVHREAQTLLDQYGVKASPGSRFASLSGGNQQRVVLARELSKRPVLLIAAQPTRGLDVGGTAYVHGQLRDLAAAGRGVLLISSDMDELLVLAYRIAVLHRGEIVSVMSAAEASRERLGLLMTGASA
jgi:simple sugar transport system ATP-binding protein